MAKTARIIDGKKIAESIRQELRAETAKMAKKGLIPGLAVVLVGDHAASQVYVAAKTKACADVGIQAHDHRLPKETPEKKLLALVAKLNTDPKIHGILVQLPLPKPLNEKNVIHAIDPAKDVDGLHPYNVGKLMLGEETFVPCTPWGCQELLLRSGFDPAGKHVVIVGRSQLVGKPLAAMLMQKAPGANATVTVCHSLTKKLAHLTREADILVAAIGVAEFIKPNMVKEGAVVIDVGVNRIEDASRPSGTRLVGDVAFAGVSKKAKAITPVPGGVGPMTITMLLSNTIKAAKQNRPHTSD